MKHSNDNFVTILDPTDTLDLTKDCQVKRALRLESVNQNVDSFIGWAADLKEDEPLEAVFTCPYLYVVLKDEALRGLAPHEAMSLALSVQASIQRKCKRTPDEVSFVFLTVNGKQRPAIQFWFD